MHVCPPFSLCQFLELRLEGCLTLVVRWEGRCELEGTNHTLRRAPLSDDERLRERELEAVRRAHVVEGLRAPFHENIHTGCAHRLCGSGREGDHFALGELSYRWDVFAHTGLLEDRVGHLRDEERMAFSFDLDVELAVVLPKVEAAHELFEKGRRERLKKKQERRIQR